MYNSYYKICCNIQNLYASRNFKIFCSNEAGWNTANSCQNIKNIFVLASDIICLQIISQTSAELKSVDCINDLQVEVYVIPMVDIIRVCWLQCKWLPAHHTIALSLIILHKKAYRCTTKWHLKQLFLWYEENNLFPTKWETQTWCKLLQALLCNVPQQDGYTTYSCVWPSRSPIRSCSLLAAAVGCFAGGASATGSSSANSLFPTLLESICIMLLIARKSCNNTNCLCRCVLNFIQHRINYWWSGKERGIWTKTVNSELSEKYAAVMA